MENFFYLLNFVLLIYMILVLIKPQKFMPFVNTTNGKRRLIAVGIWIIAVFIATAVTTPNADVNKKSASQETQKDSTDVNAKRLQAAKGDSADIAKGDVFNVSKDATVDDIVLKAALYMAYTSNTDTITDPTLKSLRQKNAKAAKKLWEAKSPQLRKQYAAILKDKFWEHDIDVKTTNGGKDIWFIGGIFAAHKNIKDFEAQAEENLKALGFHRAYYKWVDTDLAESTYYDLN